jgi:hypothetical protein
MPRGRSTRNEVTLTERRRRVAALYLENKTQGEIARALSVNQSTVSRDLEAVGQEWLAAAATDLGARKAEELAKLDHLEREAWEAWDRSQRPAVTETEQRTDAPAPTGEDVARATSSSAPPPRVERARKTRHRAGNPAFLHVVLRCVEQRCKILGFDAPKKLEGLSAVVAHVEVTQPELSDEEAELLADMAERFNVLGPAPAGV